MELTQSYLQVLGLGSFPAIAQSTQSYMQVLGLESVPAIAATTQSYMQVLGLESLPAIASSLQTYVQVLGIDPNKAVNQLGIEVLGLGASNRQVHQLGIETLGHPETAFTAKVARIGIEVLSTTLSSLGAEVEVGGNFTENINATNTSSGCFNIYAMIVEALDYVLNGDGGFELSGFADGTIGQPDLIGDGGVVIGGIAEVITDLPSVEEPIDLVQHYLQILGLESNPTIAQTTQHYLQILGLESIPSIAQTTQSYLQVLGLESLPAIASSLQTYLQVLGTNVFETIDGTGGVSLGGSALDGETEPYIPVENCNLVDFMLDCYCTDVPITTGGLVLGSLAAVAVPEQDADGLFLYLPLGEQGETDISRGIDAEGFGPLDITKGIFCENAEQFNLDRYYRVPYMPYWHGFTMTTWIKPHQTIYERTIFSFSPAFRLGLTWLNELTLQTTFFDESYSEVFTEPISNEWHHLAVVFNPGVDMQLYIDGEFTLSIPALDFFDVAEGSYVGYFDGGSYLQADMQDFRLYYGVKSPSFIKAEKDSFCNIWIEPVN